MARRTDFKKAISYTGQSIKGLTTVSLKIDGVRLLYRDEKIVTRNNKEPRGLNSFTPEAIEKIKELGDVEVYRHGLGFSKISGELNSFDCELEFGVDDIYSLNKLDKRLYLFTDVTGFPRDCKRIKENLDHYVSKGYEGLVLRTEDRWYRVKPKATADVFITGWFEQEDKHGNPKGVLGGFESNWGRITALSDEERTELWDNPDQHIGKLAQVTYRERYHTGKFRYAVTFDGFRTDKDEESFDTEIPEV